MYVRPSLLGVVAASDGPHHPRPPLPCAFGIGQRTFTQRSCDNGKKIPNRGFSADPLQRAGVDDPAWRQRIVEFVAGSGAATTRLARANGQDLSSTLPATGPSATPPPPITVVVTGPSVSSPGQDHVMTCGNGLTPVEDAALDAFAYDADSPAAGVVSDPSQPEPTHPELRHVAQDECLLRLPIFMSWDRDKKIMTPPVRGTPTYHGFVREMVPRRRMKLGAEPAYLCWFDDHSEQHIPASVLRRCVVDTGRQGAPLQAPVTLEVKNVVATLRHVWGPQCMPACLRSRSDGNQDFAAFLLFDTKTVGVNQHRAAMDVVDHLSPIVVEFGFVDDSNSTTVLCSVCLEVSQRRASTLSTRTACTLHLPVCRHIVAIRHVWRSIHHQPALPDSEVDYEIANRATRYSHAAMVPSNGTESTVGYSTSLASDDLDQPMLPETLPTTEFPCRLPTTEFCHFGVLQV